MFETLVRTSNDPSMTLVRIVLGLVIGAHATQKVFGWFGGGGIAGTVEVFGGLGIPSWLALIAIAVESLSCIGLIVGFMSRFSALGIIAIMIGAIVTLVGPNGFFMNWFGQMEAGAEGYEYHLLAITMAIAIIVRGGGALSVDRILSTRAQF